ncbi:MAG: hypothetical protein WAW00_00365 [Candidatus Moraniibacteriota bacterium]
MEEKTTRTEDGESHWKELLLETVVRSIQSFFDGTIKSVHQAAHTFTRRLARRIFLFLCALLGIAFLLIGLAKLLGAMYRLPGAGEMIVGAFILMVALVVYAFRKNDHS